MERRRLRSGTLWGDALGYSGAVRVGDRVAVSGTTGTDEDGDVSDVTDVADGVLTVFATHPDFENDPDDIRATASYEL